jgi:hypothetical protein
MYLLFNQFHYFGFHLFGLCSLNSYLFIIVRCLMDDNFLFYIRIKLKYYFIINLIKDDEVLNRWQIIN